MFLKEYEQRLERRAIIVLSILYLAVPLLLYSLKGLDDNSLVAWGKVFMHVAPLRVCLAASAGIPLAWILSRFKGPGPAGLFIISFAFGAAFWNVPEVIIDASRYAVQAKHLSTYGTGYFFSQWGRELFAWTDMPLMPMLFGLAFKISGESRWAIQVLNTACFAGAVSLTSLVGHELFSERDSHDDTEDKDAGRTIGNTAGGLLLAMPYLYTQIPLMLVDVGSMFFLMLSTWLFIKALKYGGLYIPAAAIGAVATIFTKYSLWLMFSVHGLIFLMLLRDTQGHGLRRGLLVLLFVLLMAGAAFLYYQDVIDAQIRLLISYQKPGLKRWSESFVSTFLFQMHPLIIFCAVYSIWAAIRKVDVRYIIIVWLIVLMVGILHVRRIRYLMPAFPFMTLMAAYGLSEVRFARIRRFMVCAAVFMAMVLASFGYMKFLKINNLVNLREAGQYLNTLDTSSINVLTYKQRSHINPAVAVPMLDLYTSKHLQYSYIFRTHLTKKQLKKSSFRFTWEYRNPEYYSGNAADGMSYLAIIAPRVPDEDDPRTAGYELITEFTTDEGFYRFKPFVYIYRKIIDK